MMTRAELERVRSALKQALLGGTAWIKAGDAAIGLIDRELAAPEVLEYRAVHIVDGYEVTLRGSKTAQDWVSAFPHLYRLESRTPAGTWNPDALTQPSRTGDTCLA